MTREFLKRHDRPFLPRLHSRRRYLARFVLIAGTSIAASQGVVSCASTPPEANTHIDRLYRDALTLLDRPSATRAVDFSGLADEIDALSAADLSADPCLAIKKARLAPVLYALAVIDGMPGDGEEKRQLQQQAKQHLLALGAPINQPGPGNFCYGKGFPQVTDR